MVSQLRVIKKYVPTNTLSNQKTIDNIKRHFSFTTDNMKNT